MLFRSLLLAFALALSACSENSTGNSSTPSAAAPAPATAEESAGRSATVAASDAVTGIPECDNFLAAYERCVADKVPEASRGTFDTSLKQWKDSWKQMASDPNTKAMMPSVCAQSQAASAQSMQAYGCSF